jgi:hypothetical protein
MPLTLVAGHMKFLERRCTIDGAVAKRQFMKRPYVLAGVSSQHSLRISVHILLSSYQINLKYPTLNYI